MSFVAIVAYSFYFFFLFLFHIVVSGDMMLKISKSNKVTIESIRQTEIKLNYILFVCIVQYLYFENHCPLRITHNSISSSMWQNSGEFYVLVSITLVLSISHRFAVSTCKRIKCTIKQSIVYFHFIVPFSFAFITFSFFSDNSFSI